MFSEDQMVKLGTAWICATCKPIHMQRLREGAAPPPSAAWRSGKHLVIPVEAALPERCLKCNVDVPEDGRLTKKVYWYHWLVYFLLLINILVFVIVALVLRKRAHVTLSLCREHRAKRLRHIIVAWTLSLTGIISFVFGLTGTTTNQSAAFTGLGVLLVIAGIIYGATLGRILVPTRIKDGFAWLRGAGPKFLHTLPDWPKAGG